MFELCSTDEINEGQSKGFTLDGQNIFIVKKYQKIHGYLNACPHLGIQLEMVPNQFLDSTHSLIQCSMHGALFKIEDGHCLSGPCFDQSLQSIEIKEQDGMLFAILPPKQEKDVD